MNRRTVLLAALASGPILASGFLRVAEAQQPSLDSIFNDPDAPVAGNPKGDVTIVAFLDYNCPYCKKAASNLDRIVQTDSGVRLVYKDCPVLTETSMFGARVALAAKYQGAYRRVHTALMGIPGRRNPESAMEDAIASCGVDLARLKSDLIAHGGEIDVLIRRNIAQAKALGFDGVPNFLIGRFKLNGYVDFETLKAAVAQARAQNPAPPETASPEGASPEETL